MPRGTVMRLSISKEVAEEVGSRLVRCILVSEMEFTRDRCFELSGVLCHGTVLINTQKGIARVANGGKR